MTRTLAELSFQFLAYRASHECVADLRCIFRVTPGDFFPSSPTKQSAVETADGLTSELFSILKSGTSKPTHSGRSSIDSSIAAENGILRDTLEKETYALLLCMRMSSCCVCWPLVRLSHCVW